MLKVGLTGNYFSGLEEISNIYKRLNVPVFEVDLIVKFMLFNNLETIEKIRKEFGDIVFNKGILNITIFKDTAEFRRLLKVIELDLISAYEKWRLVNKLAPFTIFKSHILFENNWNNLMNFNISVFKPSALRAVEIQKINKMRSTDIYELIDTEMDPFQKNRLSNYTIHNYDTQGINSIEMQINSINKVLNKKANPESLDLPIKDLPSKYPISLRGESRR